MFRPVSICLAAFAFATAAAHAQSTSSSIKAGLWETTITSNMQMQLPPELQARLDAMTPQQQAIVKANMNISMTTNCGSGSMVMDSTMPSHYLGSDCGSVAPNSSVVTK